MGRHARRRPRKIRKTRKTRKTRNTRMQVMESRKSRRTKRSRIRQLAVHHLPRSSSCDGWASSVNDALHVRMPGSGEGQRKGQESQEREESKGRGGTSGGTTGTIRRGRETNRNRRGMCRSGSVAQSDDNHLYLCFVL